jgi:hypothetical protein
MRNQHSVFVLDRDVLMREPPLEWRIKRVERFDALDAKLLSQIVDEEGQDIVGVIKAEFAAGSVFWLGFLDNEVAAYQWSRRGRLFRRWFVALAEDDLVIFNTVTFARYRGRHLSPAMTRFIAEQEVGTSNLAFIDCKVWNAPSIRGIERAGFRRLGIFKPLS